MRVFVVALLAGSCTASSLDPPSPSFGEAGQDARPVRMVEEQIAARGVTNKAVLTAMRDVPRHEFVPPSLVSNAYEDSPLPIGFNQTISQPYIVALMTELARPQPTDRALEIGTGSGYQAAVLSRVVSRVYTIEIERDLARDAAARLERLGYANVETRAGDGYGGWPDSAPFDIVLVTAAPDHVPPALVTQLAPRGRMVLPVGSAGDVQQLILIEKSERGQVRERRITPVRFVPLRREKPSRPLSMLFVGSAAGLLRPEHLTNLEATDFRCSRRVMDEARRQAKESPNSGGD